MAEYKLIISQKAFSNILECVSFVKNVSNEAANDLYKEIMDSLSSLLSFPKRYPEIVGLKIRDSVVRKMPLHNGRYVVLYKVDNDSVVIYDILDTRQNNILLKL